MRWKKCSLWVSSEDGLMKEKLCNCESSTGFA